MLRAVIPEESGDKSHLSTKYAHVYAMHQMGRGFRHIFAEFFELVAGILQKCRKEWCEKMHTFPFSILVASLENLTKRKGDTSLFSTSVVVLKKSAKNGHLSFTGFLDLYSTDLLRDFFFRFVILQHFCKVSASDSYGSAQNRSLQGFPVPSLKVTAVYVEIICILGWIVWIRSWPFAQMWYMPIRRWRFSLFNIGRSYRGIRRKRYGTLCVLYSKIRVWFFQIFWAAFYGVEAEFLPRCSK